MQLVTGAPDNEERSNASSASSGWSLVAPAAALAAQEQVPAQRRLLASLLPQRRRRPLPPQQDSVPAPPLHPIPILSVPPPGSNRDSTHSNPLNVEEGALRACDESRWGTWLHQLPASGLAPPSHPSSLCSGISVCSSSSSAPHSRRSSSGFSWLQQPLAQEAGGAAASGAATMSSSSSSSDPNSQRSVLVNILMQRAEPAAPTLLRPGPAAEESTPNPLLQQQSEQAALLSWRRHAWQPPEQQRQPELLRRLLLHPGDGGEPLLDPPPPCPTSSAPPAVGGTPGGGGGGRGRASFGQLLAVLFALALAVLLLHFLHSNALHQQLQAGDELPWELLSRDRQRTAPLSAHKWGSVGSSAAGGGGSRSWPGIRQDLGPGHARRAGPRDAGASAGLPRLHPHGLLVLPLLAEQQEGTGQPVDDEDEWGG